MSAPEILILVKGGAKIFFNKLLGEANAAGVETTL